MHTETILTGAGVVVATAAAAIAFQQWWTNHNQFRFALFERRIAVYDAVMELLGIILRKGAVTGEQLGNCVMKTREASFIFDEEVQSYCDDICKRAAKLMVAHHVVETAQGAPSWKQMVESEGELLIWFSDQLDIAKSHFNPFMRIREGFFVRLWRRRRRSGADRKTENLARGNSSPSNTSR